MRADSGIHMRVRISLSLSLSLSLSGGKLLHRTISRAAALPSEALNFGLSGVFGFMLLSNRAFLHVRSVHGGR